ncbi:MAG: hypothetical protein WCF86_06220 [Pseudolabrys sp.]
MRYAQDVRINKLSKLEHFVVIDVPPHIGQSVKTESRRHRKQQFMGKSVGDLLGRKPNVKFLLKDWTIFSTNQHIDIIFDRRHEARVSECFV